MYQLGDDVDPTRGMTWSEMVQYMKRLRKKPKKHDNVWQSRGAKVAHVLAGLLDAAHRRTPPLASSMALGLVARNGSAHFREWNRIRRDEEAREAQERQREMEKKEREEERLRELKEYEDSWWYPSSWRQTDKVTGRLKTENNVEAQVVKSKSEQRKERLQKFYMQTMEHGLNAGNVYNEYIKTEKNMKNLVKAVATYAVLTRVLKELPILRFHEKRLFWGRLKIRGNLQIEGGDERENRTEAARRKMERAKRGAFMMVGPPALRIAKMMRDAFEAEGHIWHSDGRLNLVGIRNECPLPLHFDDCLIIAYNTTDQYTDEVDHLWTRGNRSWRVNVIPCTTDPGMHWLQNPSEQTGTAILQPGQYYYQLGAHGGASTYAEQYEALVQAWPVKIWRDNNRDSKLDEGGESNSFEGFFGINIHRAGRGFVDSSVDRWSAGCQVAKHDSDFSRMLDIYKRGKQRHKNLFKYTLFNEERFPLLTRLAPRVARKRLTNAKFANGKWTGPTTYETFAYLSRKCIRATSHSEMHLKKVKQRPRGADGQLIPPGEHRIPVNIASAIDKRTGKYTSVFLKPLRHHASRCGRATARGLSTAYGATGSGLSAVYGVASSAVGRIMRRKRTPAAPPDPEPFDDYY